ncbi:hypothetical protein NADFUDRAFT_72210 [Nadsonia fulvescens var. elongata DSM 6958]|uniref:P-loop containing nucleoside triphosphate hydrolase protein n=1 Tax=Nadsonia fulvescens var. elongata DSM 6958 TaxID=857566 RepID=A0A1E3PCJ2_9ASCO|nr:hypothetical protein NADFUDRAFT_72210 [Nadsonia fulvescens var. elongata DSM 6958]
MTAKFQANLDFYRKSAQDEARARGCSEEEIANIPYPKHALIKALNKTFFKRFWFAGFCKVAGDVAQVLNPLLVRHLITFVVQAYGLNPPYIGQGIGFAIGVALMASLTSFLTNHFFYGAMMSGAMTKAVLMNSIYLKSMKLSNRSHLEFPNGLITNLISTDCHRIDFALGFFHFNWSFPVTMGVALALLIINIGVSALAGYGLILVSMILIVLLAKNIMKLRGLANKATDSRLSLMREVLQSMRVIKFYAWEDAYFESLTKIRKTEMNLIKSMLVLRNILNAVFIAVPTIASMLAFVTLSSIGNVLDPAYVFSSLTLFNILRLPLMFLPLSSATSVDAFLALQRIEKFLSAEEAGNYLQFTDQLPGDCVFKIENGSFCWDTLEDNKDANSTGETITQEDSQVVNDDPEKIDDDIYRKEALRTVISNTYSHVDSIDVDNDSHATETASLTRSLNPGKSDHVEFAGLEKISMDIKRGEFVVVTGSIGSGKSSLLSAMTGGMRKTSGSVEVSGSVTFCSQPWIQNATIKHNIVFGEDKGEEWYRKIIDVCSLERDFESLPAGDQTEVGERGITLSGGQKARINLARAVYSDSDIILLDDVLSAVDAHVGKHIVEKCILGLMSKKTRVLATHQLNILEYADKVIFLNGSSNIEMGTLADITARSQGFRDLLEYASNQEAVEEEEEVVEEEEENGGSLMKKKSSVSQKVQKKDVESGDSDNEPRGVLMQKEDRATDSVSLNVYMAYIKTGAGSLTYVFIPVFILMVTLANGSQIMSSTWLSWWTYDNFKRGSGFYIGIFVMLALLSGIFMFIFFYMLTVVGNHAATGLHLQAVKAVLHAPMAFFDTTPLGRIINRFSKDADTMDNEISDQTRLFISTLSQIIGVFVIAIVYLPWFALALIPFFGGFLLASSYYRASAREIKRLDSLGRSVVFSHFAESLNGLVTINAFPSAPERFIAKNEKSIDNMNSAYFMTISNQRWLSLRLDFCASCLTLVLSLLCVTRTFHINPSSVGLIISYMLQITGMLSLMVRNMAQVENNMNSVERVHYYASKVEPEAPYRIPETAPPTNWPESGRIKFQNLSMAYRPGLPLVLKNIVVDIKGGEKIGICGRTGAGKSSIMSSLYRLSEASAGSVLIDDLDISKLGLYELRSKLSIIPQDPTLFQGTVRSNIDPFDKSTDFELWDALRRSWLIDESDAEKMKTSINAETGVSNGMTSKFHLDSPVNDEGTNFSLGERQLIALARALVRKSQILILDEATASVDYETDHKIQSTITKEFSYCTILCIAHRLKTILNYDRILVLEQGEVIEFDTPLELFKKADGIFRGMCDQSGINYEDIIHASKTRST